MKCADCAGTGESENKGQPCFMCGGSGEMCDVCGEHCDEPGQNICEQCAAEEGKDCNP